MEENELLNKCLILTRNYLDNKQNADHYALAMQLPKDETARILDRLVSDGLIDKSDRHIMGGKYEDVYLIKSSTKEFLDTQIPSEFIGKPYYYHLKIQKEKFDKENIKDEADLRVKQITISNSKFQKWVPIISAFIAALSLTTTIILSLNSKDKLYVPVQELKRLQQTQDQINKSFQQFLDTLSKHQ